MCSLNATVRSQETQSGLRSSLDTNLHVGSNNASLMPSLVLRLKKQTAAEGTATHTLGFKMSAQPQIVRGHKHSFNSPKQSEGWRWLIFTLIISKMMGHDYSKMWLTKAIFPKGIPKERLGRNTKKQANCVLRTFAYSLRKKITGLFKIRICFWVLCFWLMAWHSFMFPCQLNPGKANGGE